MDWMTVVKIISTALILLMLAVMGLLIVYSVLQVLVEQSIMKYFLQKEAHYKRLETLPSDIRHVHEHDKIN